jgi:hypothetical protein
MGLLVVGVPVLVGWALAPGPASSPADVLRLGVHAWLATNLVPVVTESGTFGLLPLGLVAIPVLLLALVARWATRTNAPRDLPDAALLAGAISVVYALVAVLVGAWGSNDAMSSPPWAMFLGPLLVAVVVTTITVVHCAGLGPSVRRRLPHWLPACMTAITCALLVLVAGGAALAGTAFALQLDEATTVARTLDPGAFGSILLLVLCIGYVPNAAIWGASFAVGPGFAVGTGTSVTPSAAGTAELPAFPLFAALPADGAPPAAAALSMLLPLLAGIVAGVVLARRLAPLRDSRLSPEVIAAAGAGVGAVSGLLLGVLAALSGGPLGDGRLSLVGPSPWRVALLAGVSLATVTAATAWASARRRTARG